MNIGGTDYPELRYADDTALLSQTPQGIEKMINSVRVHSEKQNLYLNAKKTKIMSTDKTKENANIQINNDTIENITEFEYLGSTITNDGKIIKEIRRRMAMALKKLKMMQNVWQGTNKETKLKLLRSCIFPIASYGCEAWTITTSIEKIITAFEMKCYRRILKISWTQKRTNESILEEMKVQPNWLLQTIKTRKLRYFGHIKRHNGLERDIMEARAPGKRGRGRPRRRWGQDISDWMGMSITEAGRLAHQRTVFQRAVTKATLRKGHAT